MKFIQSKQAEKILSALKSKKAKIQLTGFSGSSFAVVSSQVIKNDSNPHLFIFREKESASYFINDIEELLKKDISFFPEVNNINKLDSKNSSNNLLRTEALNKVNQNDKSVIITYSEALLNKILSKKELIKNTINLRIRDEILIFELEQKLTEVDFKKVDFVIEAGQYSIRGGIVDIFSYANENPFRLEFFDNEIESIRTFDVNTQLSKELINKITIVSNCDKNTKNLCNFLDFLPKNTIVWAEDINYTANILSSSFKKTEKYLKEKKEFFFNINDIIIQDSDFINSIKNFSTIENNNNPFFICNTKISINTQPQTSINKQFDLLKNEFIKHEKEGIKNIVLCSSEEQKKRLDSIFEIDQEKFNYKCLINSLHKGYIDYSNKIAIYTDHQIFNRHLKFKPKARYYNNQAITLKQLNSLEIGDFVTHIDHGIGIFSGLHKIENNGNVQEVIKLTYQDGDILYISIHSLHKISKYSAKEGVSPKINQLGSPQWKKKKMTTKKKVKQIAFDLIKLYAKRKHKKGFSFSPDTYIQHELEASFMFEDTPDQSKATQDVKKDMESEIPMDRLVCGDVGFGKTEIAIRGALKAVADSKQVAVLVPTTILALQHFKTFSKRLANLPCKVDYINRFKSKKEQKNTIENLKTGKIDILIGTHRIVGKDIEFLDLGLLIIDEEQKFGVNIKEKIKYLKENIDTLTLSATPIPRTLQFSLLGARDLSIINTPPPNRQAVETKITPMNQEIIKNSINYEISRNGQVFYVHNRIDNISEVAKLVKSLCPDATVRIGHGQMQGKILEELMIDFMEGYFDVLVSTTIIENGVDVPNANTIIINNAHNFGLSDLHQMRGRVGRSNKKAFCFLLSPPLHSISSESRKRLMSLEQFSELGSGFKIAMRDLDIRGAGDLLGADQSGFINDVGFETYQKILNEAIEELKKEKFQDIFKREKNKFYVQDCVFDTDLEMVIPDTYVDNISERIYLYKELNNFKTEKEIDKFILRIKDRFGTPPIEIEDLCNGIRIKWIAKKLGFERIILKKQKFIALLPEKNNFLYYESNSFKLVLDFIKNHFNECQMIEKNEKISLHVHNIKSINDSLKLLTSILNN